jgi:site-specific recombinase XerC
MTPETLDYLFSEYQRENELLRGCAYRTIRTYRESYDCWRSIGSPLDTDSLRSGLLSLRERGLKPSSVNQRLRCWMIFLRWLHQRGHLAQLPQSQMLPTSHSIIPIFDSRQAIAVLRVKPTRESLHRAQSMFALSLDTALRFGEMASLLRSGIDRTAMMLSVDGKVGARRVPVSAEGLRWILRYAQRHPHQRVYATRSGLLMDHTNSIRHLRDLFEMAGVPTDLAQWHNVRRFALRQYVAVAGIRGAQLLAGHSRPDVTIRYLDADSELESLQHQSLSPLVKLSSMRR